VFGLIGAALLLFVWEKFSFDVTALLVLAALLVTGIVTPEEGLSGFADPAVITIAAMFVLTEGLERTGFLDIVGDWLVGVGGGDFWRTLIALMLSVGLLSAFVNNTAAVALFIPVVIGASARMEISPSKLLIPMSFASMFGGVTTLVGTSTNLIVSSIAEENGLEAFSMFDFTPVGLAFFVVGFVYLLALGVRLLPPRRSPEDLTATYGVGGYITDIEVAEGSDLIGTTLGDTAPTSGLDLDILDVIRGRHGEEDEDETSHGTGATLEAGDVLRVRGGPEEIERLLDRSGLRVRPSRAWADGDLELGTGELVEAVVAPDSAMVGTPIRDVRFAQRFGAIVLALRQQGDVSRDELGATKLAGGDSVLLLMDPAQVDEVRGDESFVVITGRGRRSRRNRMWLAVSILAGVVVTAAVGLAPIVVTSLVGVVLLLVTGCLNIEQAYEAVNWKVIVLLAGVLPLGVAMEKTGAAALVADGLLGVAGDLGPHAVLGGFVLATMVLTAAVTNNATAVLMAPIAISAADSIGVDPLPLLMGVTYAASLSFVTPVGYQTNTLVYGPGGYRFTDYTRVGGLLNIIFLVLAVVLIPLVFPFSP